MKRFASTALAVVAMTAMFTSTTHAEDPSEVDNLADGFQGLVTTIDSLVANNAEAARYVAFKRTAEAEVAELKTEMAGAGFDSSAIMRITEELMKLLNKKNNMMYQNVPLADGHSTKIVKGGYNPLTVEFYTDAVRMRLGIPVSSFPVLANGKTFATELEYKAHLEKCGFAVPY